jgi:signal transduction histidine kinase
MTKHSSVARRNWEIFLNILYIIGAVLLLTIALTTYLNFQSHLKNEHWVKHTNQVIYGAEKELSLLKDAETGERGYVISGDSLYLEPYFLGRDSCFIYLSHLDSLTRDNPVQQKRLVIIRQAITERMALLAQVIAWKNSGEVNQLDRVFTQRIGKSQMDQVRTLLQELIQEERRLLVGRNQRQQLSANRTRRSIYLIIFASLLIDALLVITFRRGLKQRTQFEQTLEEKNRLLSLANEELAATNEDLHLSQQKLEEVNQQLEMRVSQRTQSLEDANQELIRINRDLDNFVYTASHDLKAPVANLEGVADLLLKKVSGRLNPSEARMLGMIGEMTRRLRATIDDLTEISQMQKDEDLPLESISFEQMLEEVLFDLQPLVAESLAIIHKDWGEPDVQFARKNLRSVLYNLIHNALKYRSPNRSLMISIRTYRTEGEVVLSVSDNGLGIPAHQVPKLFGLFKRFHSHIEGTGIGLYMTKRILDNSGCRIEVESHEDTGSTFKVYFRT